MGGEGNLDLESLDFDVDRISARRLHDVRSAVKAILFTALVFSVGESAARGRDYDPQLWQLISSNGGATTDTDRSLGDDPTRDDEGGWCTDAGCYIWANPYDPLAVPVPVAAAGAVVAEVPVQAAAEVVLRRRRPPFQ